MHPNLKRDGERLGDWIQTYTGAAFWPLDPRADEVFPLDVAHALGHLCRYGGHSDRFYSVAEHSVLISEVVSPGNALWGLLHDASEAYLMDLPRPIKRAPGLEMYRDYEGRVMVQVAMRFGLEGIMPEEVKEADSRILLDERAALMGAPPRPWHQDLEGLVPLGVEIKGWNPLVARTMWLQRLRQIWDAS